MYFETEFSDDYEFVSLRVAMVPLEYSHRDKVAIGRSGRTCGVLCISNQNFTMITNSLVSE
jgi:hypothetical protein